ncbi:MAG: NAD-dependent epimerase/dehydratase family protein, partial [Chloroflexus sp.]
MSTKRIVITGATGLIGRKLVAELRNDYEIVIFSRDPARARLSLPGAADYVAWQPAEQ